MNHDLRREVEALRCAPIAEVRSRYRDLFGEEPRTKHRESLFRQIAWRMQAIAEGGLSERAKKRALAIANDADLRLLPPRIAPEMTSRRDPRLPAPGMVVKRDYQGRTITVTVLADGFEYEGQQFASLSAVARRVTGTRWNGLAFFKLTGGRAHGR